MAEGGQEPLVETLFAQLRQRLPALSIERLAVTHSADDDNVWFVKAGTQREVQIDSHPGGRPPFLIEGDLPDQRQETSEVTEAVELIIRWLTPS